MINVPDASFMLGDNVFVVNLTVVSAGKLQRQYQIIDDHRTREDQAKRIIKFVHINVNDNPAEIATKICAYNTWCPLAKTLLLWNDT